jgi:hypothetical protein
MKRLDLKDVRIGKLIVIGYSHSHIQPSGQKRAMWDVVCDCGTRKQMSTSTLRAGSTISCGCQGQINRIKSRTKPFGIANENYYYLGYKARATKRFGEFHLSKDEFVELVSKNCFYCGAEPENRFIGRSSNGKFKYNGIDRIDSKKPYLKSNCLPCCKICNTMKMDLSVHLFLSQIDKIQKYAKKRKFS